MTSEERENLKFYGYNTKIELAELNQDKINFLSYLNSILKGIDISNEPANFTAAEIVQSSKSCFERFFAPQDIILINPEQEDMFVRLAKNNIDPKRIRRVINRFTIKTSPFNIPIIEDEISGVKSYLSEPIMHHKTRLKNTPFPTNNNIIYRYISVNRNKTIATPFEYTHEVTHTQTDAHIGSVEDYFNNETLSIFMEKLHAYYEGQKEFQAMEIKRLYSLYKNLIHYNQYPTDIESYAYIESTIKAEILFYLFLSSPQTQKYIIGAIQNIFSGYGNLEKLFADLNISSEGFDKYAAIERNLSR